MNSVSRRGMVTALGAGALLAQGPRTPRIGVIGLGNRSRSHFEGLKHLPEAAISALCDLDSQRIEKVNAGLPAKTTGYTDYRELIADPKVDAVVIVAPNFLHHEMVLAALRAGKDVLVEKPLALTYPQAREIVREARRRGRVVVVGMQRRFAQPDVRIRELVESGRIGAVKLITYSEYRGDWNPNSWQYTDPATGVKTNWRYLKKTAGSTELEMCVHSYGFIYSLVKSPLARLSASGSASHYPGRETRDICAVLVDFQNGARLQHSLCMFAQGVGRTCAIIGERGSIELAASQLTVRSGGKPQTEELTTSDDPPEVQLYREFFDSIRTRRSSLLSPEIAIEPSKIAYAAEIGIVENRIVTAKDFE